MQPNRRHIGIIALAAFMILLLLDGNAWAQREVAGGVLDEFVAQTSSWWGILREKALGIFKIVVVIDVCLFGIRMALPGSNPGEIFKEFISLLMFAGFIAMVIVNYEEWSKAVAINGLTGLVGELTDENFSVDKPFEIARALWDKTYEVTTSVEVSQLPRAILYMAAAGFVMVAMFFLCALMIMAKCEFYIVANIGVLLIGLGGGRIFKDYATNVMRYVLSIGVKIFLIQLLANVGLSMIALSNITNSANDQGIAWPVIFTLIAKSVILLVLARTLPDSCAGMISGAAVGGGNPMAAMAMGVGGYALGKAKAGAGGMAKAGAGAAGTVRDSYNAARAKGASGVGGTLKGMKESFSEARGAAKEAAKEGKSVQDAGSPGSIRSQLRSQANAARAMGQVTVPETPEAMAAKAENSRSLAEQFLSAGSEAPAPAQAPASPDAPAVNNKPIWQQNNPFYKD